MWEIQADNQTASSRVPQARTHHAITDDFIAGIPTGVAILLVPQDLDVYINSGITIEWQFSRVF